MATPRKRPEDKVKTGRPDTYNKEMADRICELIATHDVGLNEICAMYPDLPHEVTIRRWQYRDPEFCSAYGRARIAQANLLAENTLRIASNNANDTTINSNGDTVGLGVVVARNKLEIDTRRWLASKLIPNLYGNEQALEQKTAENEKLQLELTSLRAKLDEQNRKD